MIVFVIKAHKAYNIRKYLNNEVQHLRYSRRGALWKEIIFILNIFIIFKKSKLLSITINYNFKFINI